MSYFSLFIVCSLLSELELYRVYHFNF